MITISTALGWILSALLGGAGLIGLLMMKPRHTIEKKLRQEDNDRTRLNRIDELDKVIADIQDEQTVQCYCILACLKGLAEQGCNGPVHEGIDRMEKHLNIKAHKI